MFGKSLDFPPENVLFSGLPLVLDVSIFYRLDLNKFVHLYSVFKVQIVLASVLQIYGTFAMDSQIIDLLRHVLRTMF